MSLCSLIQDFYLRLFRLFEKSLKVLKFKGLKWNRTQECQPAGFGEPEAVLYKLEAQKPVLTATETISTISRSTTRLIGLPLELSAMGITSFFLIGFDSGFTHPI
ncbi:MAG TPA: hypothetical protein DCQ32_11605 [Cyanobacteria bacterium UBA8156]|nr:hypothetical protein [Cyanobacteria bacterium UBA8156]